MSETEPHIEQETERAERPVLRRTFDAHLTPGEGRTVDVRIVPFGVSADVSDGGPIYREEWASGAFDEQLVAGHRLKVLLNFEHGRGIANVIGKGVSLRSEADGLHGSFEVLETQDGDKALNLVKSGILDGVSLEAYAKKSVRTVDGVVRRVRAHLQNVALCRTPAFADARVLAVREDVIEDEVVIDASLLPITIDPDLVARCRQAGVRLPQRYMEAHPAETDTPAQAGTPEDGTRPETVKTGSSEV